MLLSSDGRLSHATITVDDVDQAFAQALLACDTQGAGVTIRRTFRELLGTSDAVTIFDGRMGPVSLDDGELSVPIKSWMDTGAAAFPERLMIPQCPYAIFDSDCDSSGDLLSSGDFDESFAADAISTTAIIYSAGMAAAHNAYNDGELIVTDATSANYRQRTTVKRHVNKGTGAANRYLVLDRELPYDPEDGMTCEVRMHCDGTVRTCKQVFSNYLNYGGFPTIPEEPLV